VWDIFREEFSAAANVARAKSAMLSANPVGYFVASMLAGIYVGLGILLIFTIGGLLSGLPHARIVMGVSFGIALSLVVIAGAELFTGNNLVMTAGRLSGTVSTRQLMLVWIASYFGNWLGSILIALLFCGAGLAVGPTGAFIAATSAYKTGAAFIQLFMRGVLCNVLVCAAVWCGYRCKSEAAKLIMIFWCLYAFITSGYEHSIANMTLLSVGLLAPGDAAISTGGYLYNILTVTLGNVTGGVLFVALPYFAISRETAKAAGQSRNGGA
jgi:nitrite transporter NirC